MGLQGKVREYGLRLPVWLTVAAIAGYGAAVAQGTGAASAVWEGPPGLLRWIDATAPEVAATPELVARGAAIYRLRCAICHGRTGQGDGPAVAYLDTPPRDFTRGIYKFRTTPQDGMPADLDLFRSITAGFPLYGMPSFRYLSVEDRWALVHFIKGFYAAWERFGEPALMQVGAEPPARPDTLARGKQLYETTFNCAQCHGPAGHGDGPRVTELTDYLKRPIAPRDFTLGPAFRKAGWRLEDTARIAATGLPGTPMPSHLDQLADPNDPTALWDVARYVEHLIEKAQSEEE